MRYAPIPEDIASTLGSFHDAIYMHLGGLPGTDTVLKSLQDAVSKAEVDAALRGAKIFVAYNVCPESQLILGQFHHLIP